MRIRLGIPGPSSLRQRSKGKARRHFELGRRAVEGNGGPDGVVLALDMVETGSYAVWVFRLCLSLMASRLDIEKITIAVIKSLALVSFQLV